MGDVEVRNRGAARNLSQPRLKVTWGVALCDSQGDATVDVGAVTTGLERETAIPIAQRFTGVSHAVVERLTTDSVKRVTRGGMGER